MGRRGGRKKEEEGERVPVELMRRKESVRVEG